MTDMAVTVFWVAIAIIMVILAAAVLSGVVKGVRERDNDIVNLIIAAFIICAIAAFVLSSDAQAGGDRTRIYDLDNGFPVYDGYAERQTNGTTRFYDRKGRYTGRADKNRVYNRSGRVIDKLYMRRER